MKNASTALTIIVILIVIALSGCSTGSVSGTNPSPTPSPSPTPQPSSHSVQVTWDASPSGSLQGYKVYRGQVSGGPYASVSGMLQASLLQFSDTTVLSGQTYFYVVTSVDVNGLESTQSPEVSVSVPTP